MANIKFSQFTVGNTQSDIDFVVGYKGPDNVQISPTNLLASSLGNYLPLAGGTMTGNIASGDNVRATYGTGADLQLYHTGTKSLIVNINGDLDIQNQANDGDILFKSDDGSGGTTEYFRVDGGAEIVVVSKEFRFADNVPLKLGAGPDLSIKHDGSNSIIENSTGDLDIQNLR
jgi:hypothetical protein